MNMICVATCDDGWAFQLFTDAGRVGMQSFHWVDKHLPVFGAKHDMDVVFYK